MWSALIDVFVLVVSLPICMIYFGMPVSLAIYKPARPMDKDKYECRWWEVQMFTSRLLLDRSYIPHSDFGQGSRPQTLAPTSSHESWTICQPTTHALPSADDEGIAQTGDNPFPSIEWTANIRGGQKLVWTRPRGCQVICPCFVNADPPARRPPCLS